MRAVKYRELRKHADNMWKKNAKILILSNRKTLDLKLMLFFYKSWCLVLSTDPLYKWSFISKMVIRQNPNMQTTEGEKAVERKNPP